MLRSHIIPNLISLCWDIFLAVMEKQRRQLTPEQDALEYIVACRDKPFLEEKFINSFKGKRYNSDGSHSFFDGPKASLTGVLEGVFK